MMVRALRGLVAATVLVAAVSVVAEAQQSSTPRFGVRAGIALPMGDSDWTDDAGLGIGVGASYDFALGSSGHAIRVEGDWTRFSSDAADNWSLLGASALFVFNMNSAGAMSPYLLGGVGFHQWKISDDVVSLDDTALSFAVGAGYNFKLGNRPMFAEVRYQSVQSDGDVLPFNLASIPVVIGMKF